MAQIDQERIGKLTAMSDAEMQKILKSQAEAAKWSLPVDYTGEGEGVVSTDKGSKQVPLSRVALLTKSTGLVPQSMLPSRIDNVVTGTMSVDCTTFTSDTSPFVKYKATTPRDSGEECPSIDDLYSHWDSTKKDYQQYRYVPTADIGTASETGSFVPIPSDLVMVDGEGTEVTDVLANYTRQVDIVIGAPAAGTGVLEIQSGKLIHTTSGVTQSSVPVQFPSLTPTVSNFGDSFNVPKLTVNNTGHVTAGQTVNITIPSTAASYDDTTVPPTSIAGLVKIGTNIQSIKQNLDKGTTAPTQQKPYVEVAAADHVHAAGGSLTLQNANAPNGNVVYNGSAGVTYDCTHLLKATLPSTAPTDGQILIANNGAAAWENPGSVFTEAYAFGSVVANSTAATASSVAALSMTNAATKGISFNSGTSSLTGLKSGKVYLLSYGLGIKPTAADANLYDFMFTVDSTYTNKHVLDKSIGAIAQYVNGTIMFTASGTSATVEAGVDDTAGTWKYTEGEIQVIEVR